MGEYKRLEDLVVYHLYIAHLKGYETQTTYEEYRARYQECIRMLNGLERTLEKQLPESNRRWPQSVVREDGENYGAGPTGFSEPRTPNPEPWNPRPGT